MGKRLHPMMHSQHGASHDKVSFFENGNKMFTVWLDSMPNAEHHPYETYVLHVDEHYAGTAIVGVKAYDDMVAEFDAMVATLKTNPEQHITTSINERMIMMLADFINLSRLPAPPVPA